MKNTLRTGARATASDATTFLRARTWDRATADRRASGCAANGKDGVRVSILDTVFELGVLFQSDYWPTDYRPITVLMYLNRV